MSETLLRDDRVNLL